MADFRTGASPGADLAAAPNPDAAEASGATGTTRAPGTRAPIRILHVIHSLVAGGIERQLLELLKGMKDDPGFVSELVLLSDVIQYDAFWSLGIKAHFLPRAVRYDPMIFLRLHRVMREFRPHIVHAWSSMCSFYSAPLARLAGAKVVNAFVQDAPAGLTWRNRDFLRGKLTIPFSDVVVANSRAGLSAYRVPPRKGICIVNGFDPGRIAFLMPAAEMRRMLRISTPHVVGMVASFSDRKDWDSFFRAARTVTAMRDDVTFIAVGDGPNRQRYETMLSSDPSARIRMLGLRQDVESVVNTFTIGVLTSNAAVHGEGIANAIMEYMAVGKPVLATECGGTREIVEDGQTGYLLSPNDVETLVGHIVRLLDDSDLCARSGEAGRLRIEQEFSLARMIDAHARLYRGLSSATHADSLRPA
ncbi:MAG: glycosyltransferase [Rhizomicrobium sp.]|jgi:glycosyltransferase involved in cell wall biosynthesis